MSYKDYLRAVELIEKNKGLINFNLYPQSDESIEVVEKFLNIKFPKSYKDFLKRYGQLAFEGEYIDGLNYDNNYTDHSNIISNILNERNFNYDYPYPLSFVPIYELGNGEKFCLDTAKVNEEGECPMMGWYFGRIESLKEDVGKDFGDFLLNFIVKRVLKVVKEEGKEMI